MVTVTTQLSREEHYLPTCAICRKWLVPMEGKKLGGQVFCSDKCMSAGPVMQLAHSLPDDAIQQLVQKARNGTCPNCRQKRGPVDIHNSHTITSVLIISTWSTDKQVSCTPCARKKQLGAIVHCILLGWWGLPWGIFGTPIQVVRNIVCMVKSRNVAGKPSRAFEQFIRVDTALALPPEIIDELYPRHS